MKRLITAVTAATLALSLVVQAAPAAAAQGYDSAYAGESAFLNLTQGALGTFTVFFVNTGTATWVRGTATQVDLGVCLDNKVTCNISDPAEAGFNNNWLSTTRYATHTQTSVAPGQAATFTYSVRVPLTAAAGTYTFNGALVVAATGEDVHNEGYFQQATVAVLTQSALLKSLDPDEGSVTGGDNVVISGEGFVCSPTPTVKFGANTASILSCGSTSLTAVTPAATAGGDVDVTVTNAGGAGASNKLTFSYVDDVAPTFESITVESQTVTLTFSEAVCINDDLTDPADISIKVNGLQADWLEDSVTAPACNTDTPESSFTLQIDASDLSVLEGDNVSVTITADGADKIEDATGTAMAKGRTRSVEAVPDEIPPTLTEAEATEDNEMVLTWDEGVDCGDSDAKAAFTFKPTSGSSVTATAVTCNTSEEITLTFPNNTFDVGDGGTLAYDPSKIDNADRVEDASGNAAAKQEVAITPLSAPIVVFAKATDVSGFTAVAGDVIELAFDREMTDTNVSSMQLLLSDGNDTSLVLACGWTGTADTSDGKVSATCTWNPDADSVEIELMEDTDNPGDVGSAGGFTGLQWPATIEDAIGWTSVADVDLDVDGSEDVKIEK